jgi:hypothetical protein
MSVQSAGVFDAAAPVGVLHMRDFSHLRKSRPAQADQNTHQDHYVDGITAGEKRDIDRCIRADRRLKPSEKIIAEAIVDFMNAKTGATYPSDQALADRTGLSVTIVIRSRVNLKKTGWLDWDFVPGRANNYQVLTGNIEAIEAEQAALDEARKKVRNRPSDNATDDPTSVVDDIPPLSSATDPLCRPRQTNPLSEPTEGTHRRKEVSEAALQRRKQVEEANNQKQEQKMKEPTTTQLELMPAATSKPPRRRGMVPASLNADFGRFWDAYPRKMCPEPARERFTRFASNGIATADEMIAGAQRYAEARQRDGGDQKFTRFAWRWLEDHGWLNAYDEPAAASNNSSLMQQLGRGAQIASERTEAASKIERY